MILRCSAATSSLSPASRPTIGSYLSEIAQQRVVLDRVQAMHPDAPPESLVEHGPIYEESYRRGAEDAEELKVEVCGEDGRSTIWILLEIKGLTYQSSVIRKQ